MNQQIVLTDLRNIKMQNTYVFYRFYKSLDTFNLYLIIFPPNFLGYAFFNSLSYGPDDTVNQSSEKNISLFPNLLGCLRHQNSGYVFAYL